MSKILGFFIVSAAATCFHAHAQAARPTVKFTPAESKAMFQKLSKADFFTNPSTQGASTCGVIVCTYERDADQIRHSPKAYNCYIEDLSLIHI